MLTARVFSHLSERNCANFRGRSRGLAVRRARPSERRQTGGPAARQFGPARRHGVRATATPGGECTAGDRDRPRESLPETGPRARAGPPRAERGKPFERPHVGRIELDRLLEGAAFGLEVAFTLGQPCAQRGDAFLRFEGRGEMRKGLSNLVSLARRETAFQLHSPDDRIVRSTLETALEPGLCVRKVTRADRQVSAPPARPGRLQRAFLPARSSAMRTPSIGNGSMSSL